MPSDEELQDELESPLPPDGEAVSDADPAGLEATPETASDPIPVTGHSAPTPDAAPENPRWLHPTSFVFDALSHIRSYLVPFLLALFGAAQDELFWQYFALIILILSLFRTLLHYFTLRYRIAGHDLVINSGLLFRRVRTIPIRKIQNLDLIQNPLHRLFGVAEVRIETASGAEADAVLRVLSLQDVEQLRAMLFPESPDAKASAAFHAANPLEGLALPPRENSERPIAPFPVLTAQTNLPGEQLLRIPLNWLALAGLSSDRGLLLVGVALGALFQFNDQWLRNRAMWSRVAEYANTWTAVVLVLIGGWLLLKLLSIGWFTLRFFDYRLIRVGDDLRLSSGLFTRVSATIPRQRIQFISIHRPLLFRWAGFATIKLETAGGAGKEGEGGTTVAARSWFVPAVPIQEVPRLLRELRSGLEWREAEQAWQPVSPRTGQRLLRIGILTGVLLTIAAGVLVRPWGALAGLLLLPAMIFWALKKGRSHSYARTPFGVAYRSGLVTRKTSLTFFERIQSVTYKQSPFDRRWRMARLAVDTAAAGPAEHVIEIPYLAADFASHEFEYLRHQIACAQGLRQV